MINLNCLRLPGWLRNINFYLKFMIADFGHLDLFMEHALKILKQQVMQRLFLDIHWKKICCFVLQHTKQHNAGQYCVYFFKMILMELCVSFGNIVQ